MHKNIKFIYGALIITILGSILVFIFQNYINQSQFLASNPKPNILIPKINVRPFIHPFCLGSNPDYVALRELNQGHDPLIRSNEINLADCNLKVGQATFKIDDDGSYRAYYSENDISSNNGFISYKILAENKDTLIVLVKENGGGSYTSLEILTMSFSPNLLKILSNLNFDQETDSPDPKIIRQYQDCYHQLLTSYEEAIKVDLEKKNLINYNQDFMNICLNKL